MDAVAHFTVTQVRVAATCPRILYFDAEQARRQGLSQPTSTRIWKASSEDQPTACGSLFHAAIENFNGQAARDPVVRQLLETAPDAAALAAGLLRHVYLHYVNQETLFQKTGLQQQAFVDVLRRYLGELADILVHARHLGQAQAEILEQMFGDRRRRVDVTFPVGPHGEPVHVTGILDYVFYDWRTAHHRILDYKLTPAQQPANDLFQACVYALMHHVQYQTEPDVGVLYLHPNRQMVEKPWEQVYAQRHRVFDLLASMREWVQYDEKRAHGLKPPGDPIPCAWCRWDRECVQRLGPKHEGQRRSHWSDGNNKQEAREPVVTVQEAEATPLIPPAQEREELADRASGELWIGQTVADERPVNLPSRVLPTHVAVVGAAGSGKTWLAKVLAEEAVQAGIPVLAVDPQGDLVQFLRRGDPAGLSGVERQRYEQFCKVVEPRVLTPGSSHGIRVSLNPIRLSSAKDLEMIADPERREEEREVMLAAIAGNLVSVAKSGGETDSQRTFLLQILKHFGDDKQAAGRQALDLQDVVAAVNDPAAVGLDDADTFLRKTERDKLGRKLNNLLHGPSARLFKGGTPLDVDRLCRPVRPHKVPLNVVYLNALTDDDQKQYFVAALAAEIYRWMIGTGNPAGWPQLLFYLDEARDYMPAGARKPPAKEPLTRLFAQGRKYGVACLLCTQSPRSVAYDVFGNCSTKFIGRLESAQDVERVGEWFTTQGEAPTWLRERKGAAAGTFVARWPDMPPELEGQAIKSRALFSLHEGAWPPERVEQEMAADPLRQAFMG